MSTHSLVITLCVLVLGCTARNLGKRTQKDEYIRLMREMTRYDVFHDECEFLPEERQECGKRTYDKEECQLRGCCYEICEGCDAEIPWCFLAKRMISDEQCQVAYEDKDDCGYYGITEAECVQVRDCCWAPSPLPNDPPCFGRIPELTVRLVDGTETADTLSGRVEINHEEQWGTVCDDNFDQNAADVVCRSLGYEYAVPKSYAEYGEGTGPIWLDGLRCRGDEERLEDCPHNGWGSHDCGHYEDAGVVCSDSQTVVPVDYEYIEPIDYNYAYNYSYNPYENENENGSDYVWYRLGGKNGKNKPERAVNHARVAKSFPKQHIKKLRGSDKKIVLKKLLGQASRDKRVQEQPRIHKNVYEKLKASKKAVGEAKHHNSKVVMSKREPPVVRTKTATQRIDKEQRGHMKKEKYTSDKNKLVTQLRAAAKAAKAKRFLKKNEDIKNKH